MATAGSGSGRRAHRRTGRPRGRPRIERTFAELDLKQAKESSIDKAREDPSRLGSDGGKRPRPDLDRGRPRSTTWCGKLGAFVSDFTPTRLAGELDVDVSLVGRWARGDWRPSITCAIAVCELARAAGSNLTLEDIYETAVERARARARDESRLGLQNAVAIVEAARSAGVDLTLEDVYSRHFARVRARIRSGEPPL